MNTTMNLTLCLHTESSTTEIHGPFTTRLLCASHPCLVTAPKNSGPIAPPYVIHLTLSRHT